MSMTHHREPRRAPAVLRHVKAPDGKPLVQGKTVTGFANSEEAAAGLTAIVPFMVEDMLQERGGSYSKVRTGKRTSSPMAS